VTYVNSFAANRLKSFRKHLVRWTASCLTVASLLTSTPSQATVVERVVAVVGDRAILLSELRERVRIPLIELYTKLPNASPQRSAMESERYKKTLQAMIDEELEAIAAKRGNINITNDDVDNALHRLASQQGISMKDLFDEAFKQGHTLQSFREQIRIQLLDEALIRAKVVKYIRISAQDIRIGYAHLQQMERKQLAYRLQWIVLHLPAEASEQAKQERRAKAELLIKQARAGASFSELAKAFSDDTASRNKGGDLGRAQPGELPEAIENVSRKLDVGEVSNPFVYGADVVILRVAERDPSMLPPLAQAQNQVALQVFGERLQKARRRWLNDLKRSIHVQERY
jgi:peptidyl-prolyl cis-trans isomerase SurA